MNVYTSMDDLIKGFEKGHDSFKLMASKSLFHNGWDFEFHGKRIQEYLLGHYHIEGRNDRKRRPKDSEYSFPSTDPNILPLLIFVAEMPFQSDVVHGLFSYKGKELTPEEKYRSYFGSDRTSRQLDCIIQEYRGTLKGKVPYEYEKYPDIMEELSGKEIRDITINRMKDIDTMRISAYVTGRGESVEGILFGIYQSGFMNHAKHRHLMEEAFRKRRPEEFIMPVGGSYLNAISYRNEDIKLVVGITGDRSKNNGWIHESLRPLLLDMIRNELTKRSSGEEVYLVHAFPNALPGIQRT